MSECMRTNAVFVIGLLAMCVLLAGNALATMPALIRANHSVIDQNAMAFKSSKSPRGNPTLTGVDLAKTKWLSIHGKYTDCMAFHAGHQYVAYYDSQRRVCLARRKVPTGEWKVVRFQDYEWRSHDPHNHISMGIATGDGTIHLAFDHHVHPLHYRVSEKGVARNPGALTWDSSIFSSVTNKLHGKHPGKITYPNFIQTPSGGLQFSYRDGYPCKGVTMLVDYDPEAGAWSGTRPVTSFEGTFKDEISTSSSRYGYMKGFAYAPDGSLHNTWVWREKPGGAGNHDLMYAFSKDGGRVWYNNAGEPISGVPKLDTPGVIVKEVPRKYRISNQSGLNVMDSKGRLHVPITHGTDDGHAKYHAWRDVDGRWTFTPVENHGKVLVDKDDNAYMLSFDKGGDFIISGASAESKWSDWKVVYREPGAFLTDTHRALTFDAQYLSASNRLTVMLQSGDVRTDPKDATIGGSALQVIDFSFGAR